MSDDETFEAAGSGASLTFPVQAGNLKKGDFVCINDFPCRVIDISVSKTGKHGHAKANITAVDIFTNKKYEDSSPSSHTMPCPVVKRTEFQLLDIGSDGALSLMDENNNTREDLSLPADEEIAAPLQAQFGEGKSLVVIVLSAMGKDAVVGFKEEGKGS
jgi:translation initiation factor 5A